MSLNLKLNVDGLDIPLYQTPTWVAKTCAYTGDSNYLGDIKGEENIERALLCYEAWLRFSRLEASTFQTNEEFFDYLKEVNSHIKKIRELISNAKTFYLGVY
jgi:hypothetical protein